MKISIRFKIVALGALIATLATGASLLLSSQIYRTNGRNAIVESVDTWLDNVDNEYSNEDYGVTNRSKIQSVHTYVNDIYTTSEPDPEPFPSFAIRRLHYKNKYKWVYTIDNMGMYYQTEEERNFRSLYKDLVYSLRDAKVASDASSVYLIYFDETNNRLLYLADEDSYTANFTGEYHLPGSWVDTSLRPTEVDRHYEFNFNGNLGKCIPIGTEEDSTALSVFFVIEYNFSVIDAQADQMFRLELLTLSLTSLGLIIMFFILSHFLVTRNVTKLSKSASKFTESMKNNAELVVEDPNIRSKDEISDLSASFVALETEIIDYVDLVKTEAQDKERMNAELAVASKIQLEALPHSTYDDKNFKLRASIKTAKEVGGDFYDYFYLNDNQAVVTICDVSGKGIPAALFMMRGKELVKSNIKSGSSLKDAVYKANNDLIKNNDENLFITAFVCIIDLSKNEIMYVNAGHEKPYILSNGKVTKLDGTSNFVLGGEEDFPYQVEKHAFNRGDRIFLFTDGLNEAINDKEEEFSYSRIEKVLEDNVNSSQDEIIHNMSEALDQFVSTDEVFDDVTMLMVEYNQNKLHLTYQGNDVSMIENVVEQFENKFPFIDAKAKSEVGIIIDEIVNNIVSYSQVENLEFSVDFVVENNELSIVFEDNGVKFNPLEKEEKYLEEYHDDIEIGGFGISLVKTLSRFIDYKYSKGHNILTIKKDI